MKTRSIGSAGSFVAIAAVSCLVVGQPWVVAQQAASAASSAVQPDATDPSSLLSADQLDSLVAPIALYPDPLLAQTLAASTYPLELVQLQQWLSKNPDLEGEALNEAVALQPWDPSVQSMAVVPDAVDRLADDIQWTTELGNAFLSQQSDVMDAVQRMRLKAQGNGALESNEQQVVETQTVENKTVIVVQPSSPEVIYVPTYSPTVVYGPPIYPYPPIYYPPYSPGGMFVSFSVGFIWGSAWGGSCCGCSWGSSNVNINFDNSFNRGNGNRDGDWNHSPEHRGGTPYSDRATADRYGGTSRGASPSSSQAQARSSTPRQSPAPSPSNRSAGADRAAGAGTPSARPSTSPNAAGGADRSGGLGTPSTSSASSRSALGGGGSHSYSGSSARSSSYRGASSMGARGGSRGGGGRRR